jgi:hypothetical protein
MPRDLSLTFRILSAEEGLDDRRRHLGRSQSIPKPHEGIDLASIGLARQGGLVEDVARSSRDRSSRSLRGITQDTFIIDSGRLDCRRAIYFEASTRPKL